MSWCEKKSSGRSSPSAAPAGAHERQRRLGRLAHHLAELPGDRQPAAARHGLRLDEEDLAAGAGDGQPGGDARLAGAALDLVVDALGPQDLADLVGPHHDRRVVALGHPAGDPARDGGEPPLELAHPGLAGVLGDHGADAVVGDLEEPLRQPGRLDLARQQVAAGDVELLLLGVAGEADDLHPVEERPGDRLQDVRGRDEEDLGEVERQVEVVVPERVVLGRVEHLEHRRGGVAAVVGAHLVDLVDHHHRVHRAGVADRADDHARASPRRRCAGGRGSRPRRAPRPPRCGRTRAPAPGRSTGPARSCPRPGGPTKARIDPAASRLSRATASCSMMRSFTFSMS